MAYAYDRKYRQKGNEANKDKYKALACQNYLKALEFNPNNFAALYAIQSLCWKTKRDHWSIEYKYDFDMYFDVSRKLIALEPNNVALRKKIINDIIDNVRRLNPEYTQQVITWCKEVMAIDPGYTDYAYYNMSQAYINMSEYGNCPRCRQDADYMKWKKEFETYKYNFMLKLAREGNTKVREWFRANGKSWIE
jgi:tetratricopeptide (TPR) repeat protein